MTSKTKRVYRADQVDRAIRDYDAAFRFLERLDWNEVHGNPFQTIRAAHRHLRAMHNYVTLLVGLKDALTEQVRAAVADEACQPNRNKPWDDEEDEFLVGYRAEGKSLEWIADALGRTVAGCATRLSTLVGIPRGDLVEKYISGQLDGSEVAGIFVGKMVDTR